MKIPKYRNTEKYENYTKKIVDLNKSEWNSNSCSRFVMYVMFSFSDGKIFIWGI